jgi:transposase
MSGELLKYPGLNYLDKERNLGGIFYQLKNGCNWQDLPKIMGLKPPPFRETFNQKEALKIVGLFLRYI